MYQACTSLCSAYVRAERLCPTIPACSTKEAKDLNKRCVWCVLVLYSVLRWKEAKTVAVYAATPEEDRAEPEHCEHYSTRQRIAARLPHDVPQQLSYVVNTQGTWQEAGPWCWAEVHERETGTTLTDIAVIADGGEGLRQMADVHLHQRGMVTTRILDICHAQQHRWDVARLLDPNHRD